MSSTFHYNRPQFLTLLEDFQEAVNQGNYTEKIRYDTWRKLKKLNNSVKIEYTPQRVRVLESRYDEYNGCMNDYVVFSDTTYDNGFGRFFYDTVVKKENEQMTLNAVSACDATNIAALETKADYMSDISAVAESAYSATSALNTLVDSIAYVSKDVDKSDKTSSSVTKDYIVSNSGYDYRSSDSTSINIPSLDYLGYRQTDGTWNAIASKTEMEDRLDRLEVELQRKVDKAEDKCVKENDTMMKGFNFDFGPCTNDNVRMSMYGMAVKNASGNWVSYDANNKSIMNVDILNFDGAKFMYKMPVAIKDVAIGDVVIHARKPMFVTAVDNTNGTITAVDPVDGEVKDIMLTQSPFGFNFATKVVSLFGNFADAPTADQPFGNMLPFLMMSEGKDMDPMMMFMMMNCQGIGTTDMFSNPMMMYFLMKDNKDFDPMMLMCLSMAPGFTAHKHTCNCGKQVDKPATQI